MSSESGELTEEKKKNRALLIIIGAVGAILVAAVIVLLIFVLGGNGTTGGSNVDPSNSQSASPTPTESDSPTPSATPSDPPSATPAPTVTVTAAPPPPPPSGPAFTVFAPDTTVTCQYGNPPNFSPPPPKIEVRWETQKASQVWFIMGTDDAVNSGFMQVPTAGDEGNFPYEIDYPCNQTSQKFTMTILGTNGQHVSKTWTVKNNGDVF